MRDCEIIFHKKKDQVNGSKKYLSGQGLESPIKNPLDSLSGLGDFGFVIMPRGGS